MFIVHKACLIVNAPTWKFKLNSSPWLCERCRELRCSKCLKECHSVSLVKIIIIMLLNYSNSFEGNVLLHFL